MKSELAKKKSTKSHFCWALDDSKYLKLHEVRKLRNTCRKGKDQGLKENRIIEIRNWFMVELGLNTGLRVAEMRELEFGDLHIQEGQSTLRVRRGKGGRPRTVHINEEFKNICRWFFKWKQKQGQDTGREHYIFTNRKGAQLSKRALQKAFKKCIKKANLPEHYSIHCLRHTYGSHLYLASKHNLRLVQKQLGHSSVRVTEIYASLMDPDIKEALKKLYRL